MQPDYLAGKFAQALPYDRYVQTGTPEQQRRWNQLYHAAQVTDAQKTLLTGFTRTLNVLIVSGIWCGDCVEQCPLVARCAEVNPHKIDLRFVDRDVHRDLSEQLRINGGDRVPVALFMAEDFALCGVYGDRTLARYRALATRMLGPACPLGIVPPEQGELAATLQDWLDELERMQLLLRLSARLRQKYND